MRTIQLRQIQTSAAALQRLAETKFPAKLSYKIGRIYSAVQEEAERLRRANLLLVQKYGEEQKEQPGYWRVLPKNMEIYDQELNGLLDVDIEIYGDWIHLDELGEAQITPEDCAALDWLLTDGETPQLQAVEKKAS